MLSVKITELTPQQAALIPEYRQTWHRRLLSTQPIDRQAAAAAINAAYAAVHLPKPEIQFFDSPCAALNQLGKMGRALPQIAELEHQLWYKLWDQLAFPLGNQVGSQLGVQLWYRLGNQLEHQLQRSLGVQLSIFTHSSFFDFCTSVLRCAHRPKMLQVFQELALHCGWFYPFERVCLVCDRPIRLSLDPEDRLHAEAEPAIQYADGYSLYSHHGITLPSSYGKLHPHQWQAHWLLEEPNAELRRALIQGIGYARLCQELHVHELDTWHDYSLLKLDTDADIEPIFLLKMTCPSTGSIHAMRVPPDLGSARAAIRWVNWGTDPEEFVVQS
jgi:hypothetical protein